MGILLDENRETEKKNSKINNILMLGQTNEIIGISNFINNPCISVMNDNNISFSFSNSPISKYEIFSSKSSRKNNKEEFQKSLLFKIVHYREIIMHLKEFSEMGSQYEILILSKYSMDSCKLESRMIIPISTPIPVPIPISNISLSHLIKSEKDKLKSKKDMENEKNRIKMENEMVRVEISHSDKILSPKILFNQNQIFNYLIPIIENNSIVKVTFPIYKHFEPSRILILIIKSKNIKDYSNIVYSIEEMLKDYESVMMIFYKIILNNGILEIYLDRENSKFELKLLEKYQNDKNNQNIILKIQSIVHELFNWKIFIPDIETSIGVVSDTIPCHLGFRKFDNVNFPLFDQLIKLDQLDNGFILETDQISIKDSMFDTTEINMENREIFDNLRKFTQSIIFIPRNMNTKMKMIKRLELIRVKGENYSRIKLQIKRGIQSDCLKDAIVTLSSHSFIPSSSPPFSEMLKSVERISFDPKEFQSNQEFDPKIAFGGRVAELMNLLRIDSPINKEKKGSATATVTLPPFSLASVNSNSSRSKSLKPSPIPPSEDLMEQIEKVLYGKNKTFNSNTLFKKKKYKKKRMNLRKMAKSKWLKSSNGRIHDLNNSDLMNAIMDLKHVMRQDDMILFNEICCESKPIEIDHVLKLKLEINNYYSMIFQDNDRNDNYSTFVQLIRKFMKNGMIDHVSMIAYLTLENRAIVMIKSSKDPRDTTVNKREERIIVINNLNNLSNDEWILLDRERIELTINNENFVNLLQIEILKQLKIL